MAHKYTDEQKEFIKKNIKGRKTDELTEMFNNYFNLNLKVSQIRAFIKNNKLKSGIDTRFKKGNIPCNKGKKGLTSANSTSFKKGHKPYNYMPVGSERVNGDGYVDIKIADPNKWRGKHILTWEKHHGKSVPKGYAVIFGDGNNRNFDIDNLILVSRKQLLTLNKNKLIQNNADLTRTAVIIADLHNKISEVKKKSKSR